MRSRSQHLNYTQFRPQEQRKQTFVSVLLCSWFFEVCVLWHALERSQSRLGQVQQQCSPPYKETGLLSQHKLLCLLSPTQFALGLTSLDPTEKQLPYLPLPAWLPKQLSWLQNGPVLCPQGGQRSKAGSGGFLGVMGRKKGKRRFPAFLRRDMWGLMRGQRVPGYWWLEARALSCSQR